MNNQPENVRGADGIGAGAGNGVGNGAGAGKGGLAGMSLGVSSVSAKKRAEREAAQAKASESGAGGADSAPAAAIPQLDPKDPLAPLWQLDGVAHAADVAAKAIQAVHRHKANLRKHNVTGSESVLRGARASAWLEGGEPSLPDDGNITDPVLAAALRVADTISPESIGETTRVWQRAPQQVLAKFALNASPAGETEDGSEARMKAGRPVGDDKLSSAMKEQRLHVLGDFITGRSQIHAGVLSAIVHLRVPQRHHRPRRLATDNCRNRPGSAWLGRARGLLDPPPPGVFRGRRGVCVGKRGWPACVDSPAPGGAEGRCRGSTRYRRRRVSGLGRRAGCWMVG